MSLSQFMDDTVQKVDQIDWKKATKEGIALWVAFCKAMVALAVLTYLAGENLGNWVHSTNDWLSNHWARLIVPQTTAETGQATIVVEEVSNTPLPVKVEPMLPQAPLVVEDPWESPIEIEPMLPQALKPMAILFTTPQLMLVAAQAPVALLAPAVQEQPPPSPHKRRRQSAPESPPAVVVTEAATTLTSRTRGRRAHQERKKNRQAV